MENFIVIDAFNHVLIAAGAVLRNHKEPNWAYDNPEDLAEELYTVLEGMLRKLKKTFTGIYYACWDSPGATKYRKDLIKDYKAQRAKGPIPYQTIQKMQAFYELFGVKNIQLPETEADDGIFALCKVLKEQQPQNTIHIISRDHDLIQVVQAGYATEVFDPVAKKPMEIPWYSITEFKALTGDKSDNLTGVPGIGPKLAMSVFSGKLKLTEEQQKTYNLMLDVIDARRNPLLDRNIALIKEMLKG